MGLLKERIRLTFLLFGWLNRDFQRQLRRLLRLHLLDVFALALAAEPPILVVQLLDFSLDALFLLDFLLYALEPLFLFSPTLLLHLLHELLLVPLFVETQQLCLFWSQMPLFFVGKPLVA